MIIDLTAAQQYDSTPATSSASDRDKALMARCGPKILAARRYTTCAQGRGSRLFDEVEQDGLTRGLSDVFLVPSVQRDYGPDENRNLATARRAGVP